jgi:putative transposase
MSNYRRAFVPGGCWFFTVNLLERRQALLVEQIAPLRKAIALTRQALPWIGRATLSRTARLESGATGK